MTDAATGGARVEITEKRFADVTVLRVVGRLDNGYVAQFEKRLAEVIANAADAPPVIVLDLEGVGYIASVGLRALMEVARDIGKRQGRFAVASLQPMVREVFEISRFDRVIDTHETPRAALETLSQAALRAFDRA